MNRLAKVALPLAFLMLISGNAFAQVFAGNFHMEPNILLRTTENFTLAWDTPISATSVINCTGPGFSLPPTPVEYEAAERHSFHSNASFTGEGTFGCTVLSLPTNGTPGTSYFESRVNCEGVRLALEFPSLKTAVYFNRPRGSGPYAVNLSVKVKNECVGRADVSVSARPPAGITLKANRFTVFGLDSYNVPVTVTVPDSMAEGNYTGSVAFFASGSSATEMINISVRWPNPSLKIEPKDLGDVKSGTVTTSYLDVRETLGYKAAEGVRCFATFQDSSQKPQEASLGRISPFGAAKCAFKIDLPERGTNLGNYTVWIRINSSAGEQASYVNYTIPAPHMLLAPKELFLGKVTFESEKDSALSLLTVIESGGFTPLEKISFRLIDGEEDWLTLPFCDYAPPGGRTNCTFRISLGENASIGVKEWRIGVGSKNTKEIEFLATAEVYFIGIDDALLELEKTADYSVVHRFTQGETLKTNTVMMLEGLREGSSGISETASVISLEGGALSLLSQMETAHKSFESNDWLGAARGLLGARMALERISSGYRGSKVNTSALLGKMSATYFAAAEFWGAASEGMLEKMEEDAYASEGRNYRKAAEYYSLLERIYAQNDTEKANGFGAKAKEMGRAYSGSVAKAGELKRSADRFLEKARGGTVAVGWARVIANPFAYKGSIENYNRTVSDYRAAVGLYRAAGQQNELNKLLLELGSVEAEYEFANSAFVFGSFSLALLLVVGMMRVIVGMQRYRDDEDDMETGGIMVR